MSSISDRFLHHWETVDETLKTIPIDGNPFVCNCLIPDEAHVKTMDARSKCFQLMQYQSEHLLHSPSEGYTIAFMAPCLFELPVHIQNAACFFSRIFSVTDLSGFVVPTHDVTLDRDILDPKIVTSLSTTVDTILRGGGDHPEANEFISTQRLIEERAHNLPQESRVPIPPIRMRLGFTGATFKVGDELKRRNFCVLFVTPAINFAMWECVYERLLKPPKLGSACYDEKYEEWTHFSFMLKKIMRYEISDNLLLPEARFGVPELYRLDPAGFLGTMSVLNMFCLPFKMFNQIRAEFPDAVDIKIMGVPESISFLNRDQNTKEWARYMHLSVNSAARNWELLMDSLKTYNGVKDKSTAQEVVMYCVGSWPVQVSEAGQVLCFGLPHFPLMHEVDVAGIRGSFDVWLSNVGGPDSIPDLTRIHLRAFLTSNAPLDLPAVVTHFLCDRRISTPNLVLQKYHR